MIDLHTHSLLSDGELLPSELARRMEVKGYKFLAITDHVDMSNIRHVVPNLVRVCEEINRFWQIKVIPGMEITHVPLELINDLALEGRRLGAKLILVHGETPSEPVLKGTNRQALLSSIDILAHPGFISEEETRLAKRRGIYLEVSGRKGHSLANGHVVRIARKAKAKLVVNSDSHLVDDLMDLEMRQKVALGAGLRDIEIKKIDKEASRFAGKILKAG
jgi:histidinol phosphatase-like PHP family hydrolase